MSEDAKQQEEALRVSGKQLNFFGTLLLALVGIALTHHTYTLLSPREELYYEPPRRDAAKSALPAFCSTAARTAAKSASNMSVTLLPSLAEVSK